MRASLLRTASRHPGALIGAVVLAVVLIGALLGPWIAPNDPWAMIELPFLPPLDNPAVPFGTDALGRDVMSGVIHGARMSLLIGIVSTMFALLIGVVLGAVAGFHGGWVDAVLMRFTELFQAVPGFALAIVLVAIFQPGLISIVLAIAARHRRDLAR